MERRGQLLGGSSHPHDLVWPIGHPCQRCIDGLIIYCWSVGQTLPGWTSTVLIVAAFDSMQFLFTGIIGLYLGKIFHETKHRPLFIVDEDCTKSE